MKQLTFDFEEIRVMSLNDLSKFTLSEERQNLCITDLLDLAEQCYVRDEHLTVTNIQNVEALKRVQELLVGRMIDSVSENRRKRFRLLVGYLAQFMLRAK